MRYLVLSDLHANVEALDAVLADADLRTWDRCLVLGDLVGYGADPDAVLDRVREKKPSQLVRGNHDKVVCGVTDGAQFNPLALAAARWTMDNIRPDNLSWLRELPQGPQRVQGEPDVVLCHGSPVDEETYILDHEAAHDAFEQVAFRFCLFGHTHYPLTIAVGDGDLLVEVPSGEEGGTVALHESERYLINPGSIGQPRDGNYRPCYLILDTDKPAAEFYRVTYAVDEAMAKITEAGLPAPLALRLSRGV
jgi:diadenosine tetraphosphatase ApaH/serine/threonine PP2A family protein phosphatase